jgi:uncharacterized protein (DUF433 family)/DNA-binding transcriptional MerR regulator
MGKIASSDAPLSREEIVSIPYKTVARIVGISERRLLNWSRIHLLSPEISQQLSERNTVRLYSFQDVLSLLVIRELLGQKLITAQIHRVVAYLRDAGYENPLSEFQYAVSGKEIFFQFPDGTWEGSKRRSQIVIHQTLNLLLLREAIWNAVDNPRSDKAKGQIEKRRKVQGHARVFSDTRIPVEAVIRYIKDGATEKAILDAFPNLTRADIRVAKDEAKLAAV